MAHFIPGYLERDIISLHPEPEHPVPQPVISVDPQVAEVKRETTFVKELNLEPCN